MVEVAVWVVLIGAWGGEPGSRVWSGVVVDLRGRHWGSELRLNPGMAGGAWDFPQGTYQPLSVVPAHNQQHFIPISFDPYGPQTP